MCCSVAVIAFSDATIDARTLNLCRTLAADVEITLWNLAQPPVQISWQWRTIAVPSFMRTFIRWIVFVVRILQQALPRKASIVWAADIYALLPAVILARYWKARIVYDSRELYSSLSTLAQRPLAQSLLTMYERIFSKHVDQVVVSGELDAQEIAQLLPVRRKPFVILNVPFYSEPTRSERLRKECNISYHEHVLVYQGAVLPGRGLMRALEVLVQVPTLHLCVLGTGPLSDQLKRTARDFGVSARFHMLGTIPYDELLDWTASADIGWCWIEPITRSYELALPNKLFEYAMARVPIIASDLPALRLVLQQHPFGELIAPFASTHQISVAIERIMTNRHVYCSYADQAAREYCYERQRSRILQFVVDLCVRPNESPPDN